MRKRIHHNKFNNLRQQGTLNPTPETVIDELFASRDFFDPRDIIQVKYEMLRRVAQDGQSVREATRAFGFSSREPYYSAKSAFQQNGVEGLLRSTRRPKQVHNMPAEILDFIRQAWQHDSFVHVKELTERIRQQFLLNVSPKSIELALAGIQQEPPPPPPTPRRFVSDYLEIDFQTRRVRAGDKDVRLTRTEFTLLRHLVSCAGTPIPHRTLVQWVWGPNCSDKVDSLRVFMNQLRRKIEPDPAHPQHILTDPWVGYRFRA